MGRAGQRPSVLRGHRSEILVSSLLKEATESAGDFQIRENTNSSEMGGSALAPVTSYIYGYYR
jgi:hypothetical protein